MRGFEAFTGFTSFTSAGLRGGLGIRVHSLRELGAHAACGLRRGNAGTGVRCLLEPNAAHAWVRLTHRAPIRMKHNGCGPKPGVDPQHPTATLAHSHPHDVNIASAADCQVHLCGRRKLRRPCSETQLELASIPSPSPRICGSPRYVQ